MGSAYSQGAKFVQTICFNDRKRALDNSKVKWSLSFISIYKLLEDNIMLFNFICNHRQLEQ